MKHVYTFSRTLVLVAILTFAGKAKAQIQGVTTVTNNGNCATLVANFNGGDQGFNSQAPGFGNSSFYFNTARGWWSEMDGVNTTPPIPGGGGARLVSIISPLYPNPNAPGIFDIGFFYVVPNPAVNRFQVKIISYQQQAGVTVDNVEATTNFRTFAEFSTNPTPYVPSGAGDLVTGVQGNVCIRLLDQDITNAPGIGYRVEITFEVPQPQFTVFDDLSIGGSIAPAPLPVNFLGVKATRAENGVSVKWDVADEIDVKEYELERSLDARSFQPVGVIEANGKRVYSIVDGNAKAATVYYRVKSRDIDGRLKFSGIVKYVNGTSSSDLVRVYPSPARDRITVQHNQLSAGARITITTSDGRAVKGIVPPASTTNSMIDVSDLSAGLYILRVDNGKGKVETTTFVKQ